MLELWLCPSRKQNTARVMQALCEKTAQRILVVPEQFSHEAERMLCRAGGDTISRFAEVLSFSRLASRVFSIEGGSACEETDAGGRLLLMALAVEQVRPRLKLFGASTSRPEFLLQLLDTLEEFRAYCLRPELLRAASEKLSGALAVKTEEFALLMESYDAACANAGQDPSSRLTRLAAALETGTFAAGRQLYLDGFTDLNGVELEILTQLLAGGAEVTVALSCDSPAGGAQIFDAARDTIRSLQRAARQAGAAIMNLTPLIPCGLLSSAAPPTPGQLSAARQIARAFLPQFTHCKQCRADACGIPGLGELDCASVSGSCSNSFKP